MKLIRFIKTLGPGLLYAGAAIGVSHLVQSTRAGASYGYDLVIVLIIANVLKYPFFEFGPRYAAATGKNLIEGYKSIGNWAIGVFALFTISTVFAIQAAVTMVTAGLTAHVFGFSLDNVTMSFLILAVVMIVLMFGRYKLLDVLIKYVIVILALSTITAVVYAIFKDHEPMAIPLKHFSFSVPIDILFLIAFIGWMPAPIDVSVWHSLWTNAKNQSLSQKISLKQSLRDFNIGYWGTAFLALCFILLGALVMHGTGVSLSNKGVVFASQLISLYTDTIGQWSYFIIAIAAVTTMFSTTLTCLDAYPRVLQPTTAMIFPKLAKRNSRNMRRIWMVIVVAGTLILMKYFGSTMIWMVDLATTLSFITAPVLAYLNFRVVTSDSMPVENRPGRSMVIMSWTGILFLGLFSLVYLVWRFII